METGLPTSRVMTIGRNSLSTITDAIMSSGGPIASRAAGLKRTTDRTTKDQPSQVHTCHVTANRLGRHTDGCVGFVGATAHPPSLWLKLPGSGERISLELVARTFAGELPRTNLSHSGLSTAARV